MKDLSGLVELLIREKGWKRMTGLYELNRVEQSISDRETYKSGKVSMVKSYYLLAAGYLLHDKKVK